MTLSQPAALSAADAWSLCIWSKAPELEAELIPFCMYLQTNGVTASPRCKVYCCVQIKFILLDNVLFSAVLTKSSGENLPLSYPWTLYANLLYKEDALLLPNAHEEGRADLSRPTDSDTREKRNNKRSKCAAANAVAKISKRSCNLSHSVAAVHDGRWDGKPIEWRFQRCPLIQLTKHRTSCLGIRTNANKYSVKRE